TPWTPAARAVMMGAMRELRIALVLQRSRLTAALLSFALAGCSSDARVERAEEPARPAPVVAAPAACTSDADCRLFWSGTCGCVCMAAGASAPDPVCGEGVAGCASDPCDLARAICDPVRHQCVVSRTPVGAMRGPCTSDADCHVRLDACDCSCAPLLRSSPPPPARCPGGGSPRHCGTASPCMPYAARCDAATHECTLAASGE